jgi:SRSO17 transposase
MQVGEVQVSDGQVAEVLAQVERWEAQLVALHARFAGCFSRSEPRARSLEYMRGLIAPLERKNGWTLAEAAGRIAPDSTQHLLNRADWDAGLVRDQIRAFAVEHLGDPDAVMVGDETGFLKKGTRSAGVQRQYSGTAGRTENSQVATFLAYTSPRGHTLIDRELYIPNESWIADRERCRGAGIPDEVGFATKPEQLRAMLERAIEAGAPFAWTSADEAYGQNRELRIWMQGEDLHYVMATKCNDTVDGVAGPRTVKDLVAAVPKHRWRRRSAGRGAHGQRYYDWCRITIPCDVPGRSQWVLARRSLDDGEIAYYLCFGPCSASLKTLVRTAGARWRVEQCFQSAKNECGLDHYQVRRYDAWYRHITLSMAAHAALAVARALEHERAKGAANPALVN